MKKTVQISVPAVPKKTIEKEIYICDLCGHEGYTTTCILCGRDVCNGTFSKCRQFDPEESGDYPDKYCTICYSLKFDKYLKERNDLTEEYDTKRDLLEEKIRKESLKIKL